MEWYHVWRPWLTSKRVARVCQHQLSFLFDMCDRCCTMAVHLSPVVSGLNSVTVWCLPDWLVSLQMSAVVRCCVTGCWGWRNRSRRWRHQSLIIIIFKCPSLGRLSSSPKRTSSVTRRCLQRRFDGLRLSFDGQSQSNRVERESNTGHVQRHKPSTL